MTTGRTGVLTGATSGIGLAAAGRLVPTWDLAVLQGPQSEAEVGPVLAELRAAAPETTVHYVSADFREMDGVETLAVRIAEHVDAVDVLVNNAGIPGSNARRLARNGAELTFQVNYLAGVLLTNLLLARMPAQARVVNVASATHYSARLDLDDLAFEHRTYSATDAYAQSKLAVVAYSCRLATKVPPTVVSLHPGVISTGLLHAMFGAGGAPSDRGGSNVAAAVGADAPSGSYLDETQIAAPNPVATSAEVQQRLHDVTASLLGRDIA